MSRILNNLPVEDLNEENDYLGIIDKGQIIKTFLESNTDEFRDIKMFSLYGEWGSGKSTLMKYLQKELKGNFNPFFFEAWEFESDENLSLSLLEFLTTESQDSTEEAFGEIVKVASKLFKGFSKSMRITLPGLSIDGSKIIETLEEESEETFLQLKNKFKTEFIRWESFITKGKKPKYNIVFIDDLDRCEPENVLNLLSALKLFFTYGKKTIFFCGVDKKAVNEAVKTKYGKVVKANEYLEKIFDISFTMPEYDDIFRLVSQYFDDREVGSIGGGFNVNISEFFKVLHFTNPRRVKKILNKFDIMRSIKKGLNDSHKYYSQIPDIYSEGLGDYFETILVLYFILLHEFYPLIFDGLFDFKKKEDLYLQAVKSYVELNPTSDYDTHRGDIVEKIDCNITEFPLYKIKTEINFEKLSFVFLPVKVQELDRRSFEPKNFNAFKVSEKNIEFYFVEYLHLKEEMYTDLKTISNFNLIGLKKTIKNIL